MSLPPLFHGGPQPPIHDCMKSVLIVDDHSIVRKGLRSLFENSGFLRISGEAATVSEAENIVAKLKPDIIIIDVRLPDGDGISLCGRIKKSFTETRVIVLTAFPGSYLVETALREGADGILLKTIDGEEILKCVKEVLNGRTKISEDLMVSFIENVRNNSHSTKNTQGEIKLLSLLSRGYTNKEIAENLGIAEKTVRNRLSMLYRKLGVGSRTEAVLLEHGTYVPASRDE